MRLRDLDAEFVGQYTVGPPITYRRQGDTIAGAQGVLFQCPKCATGLETGEEEGRGFVRGAHYIMVWFSNPQNAPPVPPDAIPTPARWSMAGDTLDTLTLSPSILLPGEGCQWHGYVQNGGLVDA